jgi:hypothetical protein
VKDDHPTYRAKFYRGKFYIPELKKYTNWHDYLVYYKEQDDKIMLFSNYCMQMCVCKCGLTT